MASLLIAMAILAFVAAAMFAIAAGTQGSDAPGALAFPTSTPRDEASIAATAMAPLPTPTTAPDPPTETLPLPTPPVDPSTTEQTLPSESSARPTPVNAQALTFKGSTDQNTAPFDLSGGTYEVNWKGTPGASCYINIALRSTTDESNYQDIGSGVFDENKPMTATTFLYRVAPSQYYIAVASTCPWELTLTAK